MWEIITVDRFDRWFLSLSDSEQTQVLAKTFKLREFGPMLGRPDVDTITGTKHIKNLKELRIQYHGKPYRVFFVFTPARQALLLCGGNKSGNKNFYKRIIPVAENEFLKYLQRKDSAWQSR